MIRNTYYKLVFRPNGKSEFYDLKKDPKQIINIYETSQQHEEYQIVINQMLMNLTQWYVLTGDVTPILMDPRGIPAPSPAVNDVNWFCFIQLLVEYQQYNMFIVAERQNVAS